MNDEIAMSMYEFILSSVVLYSVLPTVLFKVYKIPYRRARSWPVQPLGRMCARAKIFCVQGLI